MGPLLAQMQLVVVLLQPLLRKIGPDSIRIRRRVNGANNYYRFSNVLIIIDVTLRMSDC